MKFKPIKVFALTSEEWWLGETLEDAIADCIQETGCSREEIIDNPRELTAEDMLKLTFRKEDGTKCSFLQAFYERMCEGSHNGCFASANI